MKPSTPVLPESPTPGAIELHVHEGFATADLLATLDCFWEGLGEGTCLSWHPGYLDAVAGGLNHRPYYLVAVRDGQTVGVLALAYVSSFLFGRFLVSLPYLNYGGVLADDEAIGQRLIEKAVELANQLEVRYLELRHQDPISHHALTHTRTDKVHMRLSLPASPGLLWDQISAKVRNQVRKGQKQDFSVTFGGEDLLNPFYKVFSHNMRDLGTPVFHKRLFRKILQTFDGRAELCVVHDGDKPIAGALLTHGQGITEVPSASSLRNYNSQNVNMLMYWHLLERAVMRGQGVFDFGRTSPDATTFRFKKQWGAEPLPAVWQYYVRHGEVGDTRKENPKYERMIRTWKRLPVWLTRWIGPTIVRGIP
ncbi:MAG: FemAB family XrtA/PEP-CTERM system-associated protein [Gemmataceae bacterium]